MEGIVLYLLSFIVVYLVYLLFVVFRKKVIAKYDKSKEVIYLKRRFNLDLNKINMKSLANTIALINSFIIATTVTIVFIIKNTFLMLLLGFIILIPFILIMYTILGKILQKKYGKGDKNV